MRYENIIQAFKNLGIVLCEIIKFSPGIIVPFAIVTFLSVVFKLRKPIKELIEEILGLFF